MQQPIPLQPQSLYSYGEYLNYQSLNSVHIASVKETVDHMLTQMDELSNVVDTVSLNIQTTQTLIPPLVEQTKQLKRTFALIDALEGFIQQVNQSVATLEQNVSSVEQNSSIFSQKAKRVFQSFSDFRKKKLGESSTTSPESESGISSGSTTEGTSENILNNPSATLSSTSLSASAIKFDSNYLLMNFVERI